MIVENIEYTDFRNIEKETFKFSSGVNVIFGKNAQGKTNIIEGIYLFARGKSFRALRDKEMIRFGADVGYARLEYNKGGNLHHLSCKIDKNSPKNFYVEGNKASRTIDIIGEFRSVLFCPAHLGIINDSPAIRRNFLDIAISQVNPSYAKMLSKYNNALLNRNAILKSSEEEIPEYRKLLDVYSETLASLDTDIFLKRYEYVNRLDFWIKMFFSQMTKGNEIPNVIYESNLQDVDYKSKEEIEKKYTALLNDNVEREQKYGSTLFGIHKDDLKIELNGKDARAYSSQGQQRSLAIALKMAETEISREYTNDMPVLLLDDVLSELDEGRKSFILSCIKDKQVIITSCETSNFNNDNVNFIERKMN